MAGLKSKAATVPLIGGDLCLDFVNTVGSHASDQPSEYLTNYADLVAWSQHAGIVSQTEAQQLAHEAAHHPSVANRVYQRALALRETLFRIFSAISADQSPRPADLDLLNRELASALAHARIIATQASFIWGWQEANELDRMLWRIVRSAADLLTKGNLDRVRQCSNNTCGWLFVDTTKNHSRRWCDMNDCGNRAKVHRYYQRIRTIRLKAALR